MSYIANLRSLIGHTPLVTAAVGCVIYQEGRFLLQQRADSGLWGTSGGLVEPGESITQTLVREVREELGIIPLYPEFVGLYAGNERRYVYPNDDVCYSVISIFLVRDFAGTPRVCSPEVSAIRWFPIHRLPPDRDLHAPDVQPIHNAISYLKYGQYYIC